MDDAELPPTRPGAAPASTTAFVPHDRYVLIEQLGEGGMGTVWAAHDKVLDRTVALKVLHDEFLGAADQERLAAEARTMARLSHRNVIAVYDVAERGGRMYLTMELVRGIHLGQWLVAAPRAWPEIVAKFRGAASGLAAAHAAGIIHRDIKPSNLMVGDDGELRIADFGVAHATVGRAVAPGEMPTAETVGLIGTLVYMSPQQLRGEPADVRSDQFAFFCTLYEALHGRRPFAGNTVEELCAAMERGCPEPIRDVPRWLHAATARGLSVDPAQRFAAMADVHEALRGPARRAPWIFGAGAVLAAAAAVVIAVRSHGAGSGCGDPHHELVGVWDDATRERGRAAFATLGLPYASTAWQAVATELDARAAAWAKAEGAACRADDALRTACLADERALLGAIAARLGAATRITAERSAALVIELPALADCDASAYLPAVSLAGGPAHEQLATARADLLTGVTPAGLAAADGARTTARAGGDRALELGATVAHGRAAIALDAAADARRELPDAVALAASLGAPAFELDADLALIRADLATGALDDAAAAAVRARSLAATVADPRRTVAALVAVADVALHRGDASGARAALSEAEVGVHGDPAAWVIPLREARVRLELRTGNGQDALVAVKQLADGVRVFGDLHPAYGRAEILVGEVNLALGRGDKAVAKATHAMRIAEGAFGADSLAVADAAQLFGKIYLAQQELTYAEKWLRTAYEIRAKRAPNSDEARSSRDLLATALDMAGKRDEAAALRSP